MFILSETFGGAIAPHKIGEFETADQAIEKARAIGAVMIEADVDFPGCFDAFTKHGALLKIEPKGFTINA